MCLLASCVHLYLYNLKEYDRFDPFAAEKREKQANSPVLRSPNERKGRNSALLLGFSEAIIGANQIIPLTIGF
jgi:hypothetical protein